MNVSEAIRMKRAVRQFQARPLPGEVTRAILGVVIALIGLQIYPPLVDWLVSLIGFPLW